jgi:hypothetical protein
MGRVKPRVTLGFHPWVPDPANLAGLGTQPRKSLGPRVDPWVWSLRWSFFRWGMIKFFRWSKPLFTYPSSESESSSSISGNIPQPLKHSRCLEKTSYHSPELQDQSGHGKLRIDRLRHRVRDCLKVLYRGSRYCVGIFYRVLWSVSWHV